MHTAILYATVCLSGAVVLSVEILGTRVLGPYYGASLFLWSALITVTLAALSLGYTLGGRWADRGPRLRHLGWLLSGAGAWLLVVPWLRAPLLAALEPWGLRAAVLTAALVLFAPPLTALGMVSPYAIRLRAERLDHVGRTAGNLYALSTVASVVSALLTGFYLVPVVGVGRLLLLLGLALLAGAGVIFVVDARSSAGADHTATPGRARAATALGALMLASSAVAAGWLLTGGGPLSSRATPFGTFASGASTRSVVDSPYSEVRVADKDGLRYLLLDGSVHTVADPVTGRSAMPYVAALSVTRLAFDQPGRALLLGLGGGSVARDFADAGWHVDAVEIDPAVVEAARAHFGLDTDRVGVAIMDARRYLRQSSERWDVVIFDAYGSASIPFHLVTREVFALVNEHLAPGGVVGLNVETRGWQDVLLSALTLTLETVFDHVIALPTSEPPTALGNVVLLAAHAPFAFPEERLPHPATVVGQDALHAWTVQMNHAWDNRYRPSTTGLDPRRFVLTDDRNPVDLWAEEINRVARRDLHAFFAGENSRRR